MDNLRFFTFISWDLSQLLLTIETYQFWTLLALLREYWWTVANHALECFLDTVLVLKKYVKLIFIRVIWKLVTAAFLVSFGGGAYSVFTTGFGWGFQRCLYTLPVENIQRLLSFILNLGRIEKLSWYARKFELLKMYLHGRFWDLQIKSLFKS